jgi:hypothetical protein
MSYPGWKVTVIVGTDGDPEQTTSETVHTDRDAARNVFWPATMDTGTKVVAMLFESIELEEVE